MTLHSTYEAGSQLEIQSSELINMRTEDILGRKVNLNFCGAYKKQLIEGKRGASKWIVKLEKPHVLRGDKPFEGVSFSRSSSEASMEQRTSQEQPTIAVITKEQASSAKKAHPRVSTRIAATTKAKPAYKVIKKTWVKDANGKRKCMVHVEHSKRGTPFSWLK